MTDQVSIVSRGVVCIRDTNPDHNVERDIVRVANSGEVGLPYSSSQTNVCSDTQIYQTSPRTWRAGEEVELHTVFEFSNKGLTYNYFLIQSPPKDDNDDKIIDAIKMCTLDIYQRSFTGTDEPLIEYKSDQYQGCSDHPGINLNELKYQVGDFYFNVVRETHTPLNNPPLNNPQIYTKTRIGMWTEQNQIDVRNSSPNTSIRMNIEIY